MFYFFNRSTTSTTKTGSAPPAAAAANSNITTTSNGTTVTNNSSPTTNGGGSIVLNQEAQGAYGISPQQLQAKIKEARDNLYTAVAAKRADIVISLINEWFKVFGNADHDIKYFFNCNFCENETTNPLCLAFSLGDMDTLRALLNFGADPSLVEKKTRKSLTQLINERHAAAPANDKTAHGMYQLLSDCFMQSIIQSNVHHLRQYVASGFDVNRGRILPDDASYLHWAALYADEGVVRFLIESGAEVNACNKHGATPLHECVARRKGRGPELLRIVETLLLHKADLMHIKGTGDVYKDLTAYELITYRANKQQQPEDVDLLNFVREFLSEVATTHTTTSTSFPQSPNSVKQTNGGTGSQQQQPASAPPVHSNFKPSNLVQALETLSNNNTLRKDNSSSSLSSLASTAVAQQSSHHHPAAPSRSISESGEQHQFQNWCHWNAKLAKTTSQDVHALSALLWPQPQTCHILDASEDERFVLSDMRRTRPVLVYIKPPHTYTHMDFIGKLANIFSGLSFQCIHTPPEPAGAAEPYISINIDKALFHQENAYSILVTKSKIEVDCYDITGLQYAFCTLMQLFKIYARTNIPSMKIVDFSDIKNRGILVDFSQGFYLKYEYVLSLLQMLTFYKINQVHFYAKFSSLPPASTRKQWYHFIENWFGLMKFCEEFNMQVVPAIDISNDVAELDDVHAQIKNYLDLFKGFKFINVGPRLSSLLTCMEDKNPFALDSNQYMMLCSYLYQNSQDELTLSEIQRIDRFVLMEYGFKVGYPFHAKCKTLHRSGKPFYLCVGSANWNSVLGCPDGSMHNLADAVACAASNQPLGLLLCNFVGTLNRTSFVFNFNAMIMTSGLAWNTKINANHVKAIIHEVTKTHGLISDFDGELGAIMLELGHVETYLTRKLFGASDFTGLPFDDGSVFSLLLNNPDSIELDNFDKNIFKKCFFSLRAQQAKLRSIPSETLSILFKEVSLSIDLSIHLLKFLMALYNVGTKRQQTPKQSAGLKVINVGVSNLNQTIRTDLANKLILIKEEFAKTLPLIYYRESIVDYVPFYFSKLIDQLLLGQEQALTQDSFIYESDLLRHNQKQQQDGSRKLRSFSNSSSSTTTPQGSLYFAHSDDNEAHETSLLTNNNNKAAVK